MSLCSAGKSPVTCYYPSHSPATFTCWVNPEGDDLVGVQQDSPAINGAELSPGELFGLREFSLCLWAVSGVSKLPPFHVVSWLELEQIWKVGVECALGGYSMQVQASGGM